MGVVHVKLAFLKLLLLLKLLWRWWLLRVLVPGEVVAVDDVLFFLRHTFLVFFGGVGGAGTGSSSVVALGLPFFLDLFELVGSYFISVFIKGIRLSFCEGVTSTSLIFWGFWPKFDSDHQALLSLGSGVKFFLFTIDMESDFSGPNINMCICCIETRPS